MEQVAPNTEALEQIEEKPKTAEELLKIARKQMIEAEAALKEAEAAKEADQPEEHIYTADQVSIVLCAEAITNVLEGITPGSGLATRLEQTKFWLYYLGGMPEFLPPPKPRQVQVRGQPIEEEEVPLGIPLTEDEKNLDEISAKLSAITKKEVMTKEPEPQKKNALESGLDKLMPDFLKKKPEEKTVTPDHQPVSLG